MANEIISGADGRILEERYRSAPSPRSLPTRVVDFLEKAGADHALLRMRFENRLLDETEAEIDGIDQRIWKQAVTTLSDTSRPQIDTV